MDDIAEDKSEKSIFSEICKFVVCLLILLISLYLVFFIAVNVSINSLTAEKQIELEEKFEKLPLITVFKILETNPARALEIKNKIISSDKNLNENKNQKINIINYPANIAFCALDGNIYISKSLYRLLDNDEELAFVIAHELAHYKNKNHLSILRKSLYNSSLLVAITLDKDFSEKAVQLLSNRIMIEDIHHSRVDEIQADIYAGERLIALYGSVQPAIDVLNKLDKDRKLSFPYISKHQPKEDRIELLKDIK